MSGTVTVVVEAVFVVISAETEQKQQTFVTLLVSQSISKRYCGDFSQQRL
jgi:hypothetical protein